MKKIIIISFIFICCGISEAQTWIVKNYVDEFGDKTSEKYLTNKNYIKGLFSNIATTNSKLDVKFLIGYKSIDIMLYQYGGNNPVKSYGTTNYTIYVKTDKDLTDIFQAKNWQSDRLSVLSYNNDVDRLNKIFLESNFVKVKIKENDSLTEYSFSVKLNGYTKGYNRVAKEKIKEEQDKKAKEKLETEQLKKDLELKLVHLNIEVDSLNNVLFPYVTTTRKELNIWDSSNYDNRLLRSDFPKNSKITIVEYDGNYFKIKIDSTYIGYIQNGIGHEFYLKKFNEVKRFDENLNLIEQKTQLKHNIEKQLLEAKDKLIKMKVDE